MCQDYPPPPLPRNDNQFTVAKNERERENGPTSVQDPL